MDEYQLKNFLKFAPARLGLIPKKYLLIHIPKNGGMALRKAPQLHSRLVLANRRRLKSKAYADELLEHMTAAGFHVGYEHARLRDIDTSVRLGTIPFAVVRNPWSRTFSRFKFYLQTEAARRRVPELTREGFAEFLETRHEWGGRDYFWHRASLGWFPQVDYVLNENGDLAVDLLRQENLTEEFSKYFMVQGALEKKNISRGSGSRYQQFYDAKTIQIVADWYQDDIDFFGFDFDGMAKTRTYFSEDRELGH